MLLGFLLQKELDLFIPRKYSWLKNVTFSLPKESFNPNIKEKVYNQPLLCDLVYFNVNSTK